MRKTERLFFALWPNTEQQLAWAKIAAEMLPADTGRLVPASNLHITLLYIGEAGAQQRRILEKMAGEIEFSSFVLRLDQFGFWRKPKVWWWGSNHTPESLGYLVETLRLGAESCGLKIDRRAYKPHMTLARKLVSPPQHAIISGCDWQVDGFALLRSVSSPVGVRYELLRQWQASKKG